MAAKSKEVWQFGDFQTPLDLAAAVCRVLHDILPEPAAVLEPNCGKGAFVLAAAEAFPDASLIGVEINDAYLATLQERLSTTEAARVATHHADFFEFKWDDFLPTLPQPVLVLGNPPWVTNADLGALASSNLPQKTNFQRLSGFDALTGKSNFDVSEWMLLQEVRWFSGCAGTVAMLCKTSVARKVLSFCWKNGVMIKQARIYAIDAMKHFAAAVDACLFVLELAPNGSSRDCEVYAALDATELTHVLGYHDGIIVNDAPTYERLAHLRGSSKALTWRSGVKHDCSKVMEFRLDAGRLVNGKGEAVDLEETYLYPLAKSSDLANGRSGADRRVLVTQTVIGEDTSVIAQRAPKTWAYLQENAELLAARGSSIYKNRPDFSVFGVGSYTFAPWKVAISGFYKRLTFTVLGPVDGKPVVPDDTGYFLGCVTQEEAEFLVGLLHSKTAQDFYGSMIFWSEKRPITVDLLKRLDLCRLSAACGLENKYKALFGEPEPLKPSVEQPLLLTAP